jgi:CDGSH-type Zn-finger protein
MTKGKRAGDGPIAVEVEKGKSYYWCACGLSKKQPFCDGSHRETKFRPIPYKAEETKKKFFCACKQTDSQPFCDGSHNKK